MKLTRTFKRKSTARRSLNFNKKRRTVRRGRKTNAFTSQSGSGGGLRFKSKKTSRRAYKKHLWNSTLYKDHYRSTFAASSTITTNTNTNDLVVIPLSSYMNGVTPFYLAGGGAISPDATVPLPPFNGDVTVRGGLIGIRMANTLDTVAANQGTVQVSVILIKTSKAFVVGSVSGTVNTGWDPTLVQDFDTRVGRILYRKNFLLRDADTAVAEYRLPVHKVDQGDQVAILNTYLWLVMAGNVDSSTAKSVNVTRYWNMSFAADAI